MFSSNKKIVTFSYFKENQIIMKYFKNVPILKNGIFAAEA